MKTKPRAEAPVETFTFLGATFHVTGLRAYAEAHQMDVRRLGLDSLAKLCNFAGVAGEAPGLSLFAIDPAHAATLPQEALESPGIIVRFAGATLLVDGHHRAYRRWRCGEQTMPVYVFDDPDVLARYSNVPRRVLAADGDGEALPGKKNET
jgi:hypothetical protein